MARIFRATGELSYSRRVWRAFLRVFSWGWNSMKIATLITCGILFVNGILYAFNVGGFAPDQIVAGMLWMISPLLSLLDLVLPPIAWLIRFSSSLWSTSSLIEIIAVFSGLVGMMCGTVLFVKELFNFGEIRGVKNA